MACADSQIATTVRASGWWHPARGYQLKTKGLREWRSNAVEGSKWLELENNGSSRSRKVGQSWGITGNLTQKSLRTQRSRRVRLAQLPWLGGGFQKACPIDSKDCQNGERLVTCAGTPPGNPRV
jgi:hypothetical protein